jgi:hypothetical protein
MTVNNIFNNYIPKFIVELDRANEDIRFVSTSYFDATGDVYELDVRTINPIVIQTTQSIEELRPDVSTTFPFKIVLPLDIDGANILLVPTVNNAPTASQHYYTPIYFERYTPEIIRLIDKNFTELEIFDEGEVTDDSLPDE